MAEKEGFDVVSLDFEPRFNATHTIDIFDWDYKQYPVGYFNVIWASPDCCYYSVLQNCWLGKKKKDGIIFTKEILEEKRKHSDKLIKKTLEIINYFQPELWFMENPKTGTLKDRDVVKGIPFYDVDYCMYSDWGSCGNMIEIPSDGKIKSDTRILHKNNCGNTEKLQSLRKHPHCKGGTNRLDRFRVPSDLIFSLLLD